ncbi:hypothetical protein [Aquipuribacter sp. SD81]|uniref:hypothetical protein n=1 Tax=Aquipuribacter sp. SD81 TaxID=3127703 RepID=UPI0030188FAB
MARSKEQKYTDPDLRERLKKEITEGDRGGRPGQWSARKAQLLAHEYEKAGGAYRGGKDDSQKHLEQWTDDEWQTADGDERARHGEETERYLPKGAWEKLSPEERRATERRKRKGSKRGEQHVPNTSKAKDAGRRARTHEPFDGYDDLTVDQVKRRLDELDDAALERLQTYERDHKDRSTLLSAVRGRLG